MILQFTTVGLLSVANSFDVKSKASLCCVAQISTEISPGSSCQGDMPPQLIIKKQFIQMQQRQITIKCSKAILVCFSTVPTVTDTDFVVISTFSGS